MISIIKRRLVTEKSTNALSQGVYEFEVERKATKTDVKSAVERAFKVKVLTVNTMICRGRSRRTARGVSRVKYWKKALVKLAAGEKIQLFEGA